MIQPAAPSETPAPIILGHLAPAKVSEVYETYWRFAAERQAVFFRRVRGERPPWTDDRVLAIHKFTNAYRASDRVSQYLIRNVIYRNDLPSRRVKYSSAYFCLSCSTRLRRGNCLSASWAQSHSRRIASRPTMQCSRARYRLDVASTRPPISCRRANSPLEDRPSIRTICCCWNA